MILSMESVIRLMVMRSRGCMPGWSTESELLIKIELLAINIEVEKDGFM